MATNPESIIFEKTIAEIETDERLPDVDQIDQILLIKNPIEMDNRIFKNSFIISKILKTYHKKLCENFEMTSDEIEVLLHCLKFVDTLNLFMNNQSIASILKLISKINELVLMISNLDQKDIILKQIKYTEMTIIYYKKRFFKNLFFGNGTTLAREIEKNLEMVTKKGMFDQRLFKQMQNLFYVVQGKIDVKTRGEIQEVLNEMKKTSIKYKKQRFSYYEEYNDYSDYKNYSNVAGILYDYNENFYENDYSAGYFDKEGDYKYNTSNSYGRNIGYGYSNYASHHVQYHGENNEQDNNEDRNIKKQTNIDTEPKESQEEEKEKKEENEVSPPRICSHISIPSTPGDIPHPTPPSQSDIEVINTTTTTQQNKYSKDGKNIQNYYNDNFFKNYLYIYDKPTYSHQHTHYSQYHNNNKNSEQNQKEIFTHNIINEKEKEKGNANANANFKEVSNNYTPIKKNKSMNMKKKKEKGRGVLLQEVTAEYFQNVNSCGNNNINEKEVSVKENSNEKENENLKKKIEIDNSVEKKDIACETKCEVTVEENPAEKKENDAKEDCLVQENKIEEEANHQPVSSNTQSEPELINLTNYSSKYKGSNAYGYKPNSHPYFKNSYGNGSLGAGSYNYYSGHNYYNYSHNNNWGHYTKSNSSNTQYNTQHYSYGKNQVYPNSAANKPSQNEEETIYTKTTTPINEADNNVILNIPNDNAADISRKASYSGSASHNLNQRQKSHSYSSGKYIKNRDHYYHYEFVELEDKNPSETISDFKKTQGNKTEQHAIGEGSTKNNVQEKVTTHTEDIAEIAIKQEFVNIDLDKMFEPEADKINQNEPQLKEIPIPIPNSKSEECLNLKNPVEEVFNDNIEDEEEVDENGENENENEIHPPEENSEDDLCEGEEESDSEDNEEIEEEFKKFINESLGDNQKDFQEENYYLDVEGKSKNNKVIFENDSDNDKVNCDDDDNNNVNMNKFESSPQLIENNNNNDIIDITPIPLGDVVIQKEENDNEGDINENANEKIIAENKPEGECETVVPNLDHPALNLESLKESTKSYMESIKTIDPKILMAIKSKLREDSKSIPVNNNNNNNVNPNNIASAMNLMHQMNSNLLMANPNIVMNPLHVNLMNYYQRQFLSNQIPIQHYIFSNYAHFFYRGRDANIHREYFALKCLEHENPSVISRNLESFEKRILIPIYQRINFNVNKKRGIYFYTFSKYKKLIHRVLGKDKILKKVKPYGSYMNNFLIDSGDIDICIVPKCGILEFSKYLEKVSEEIVTQNYGEHKLSHHNSRYLLLKVMDIQTKFIIDITVHNMLPILNTNLIRLYSLYDQRFHILGLYIKHWVKINKIHGAADNYLSSYALLLMLIHFLQKVAEPRVLPNLQKIENKDVIYEYPLNGETMKSNIYYEEDVGKIKAYMKKINNGLENKESATNILIRFLEYYSYYFDSDQKISIHMDLNEKKRISDLIAFSIVDPFDMQHNPGKSMIMNSVQYNKFVTSMKKEINFILNGEYVKRIEKINTNQ